METNKKYIYLIWATDISSFPVEEWPMDAYLNENDAKAIVVELNNEHEYDSVSYSVKRIPLHE